MSAPLHRLQEALRAFAQETGYGRPIRATLTTEDGEQIPVPVPKEESPLPRKMSRMELVVFQAIRSANGPIGVKELTTATKRSKSAVCEALALLKRRGSITKDGEGYTADA